MDSKSVVETVKEKAEMVAGHVPGVIKTGVETLQAAREVVNGARKEAAQVLNRTKDELAKTLKKGAAQVGDQLSRIAHPTRKEQAAARKAEVKAKKRARKQPDGTAAAP